MSAAGQPAAWPTVIVTIAVFAGALGARGAANIWLTTGLAGATALVVVLLRHRGALAEAARFGWGQAAGGLLVGGALLAATHGAWHLVAPWMPGLVERVADLYEDLDQPPGPLAGLPVLGLAVLAEELVWRGAVHRAVAQRQRTIGVLGIVAGLYALPQLLGGMPLMAGVGFGCGVVWGLQRAVTGSLAPPLLAHAVWSAGVFALAPLPTPP